MAETKRTPAERERDLEVIARKYCRGETQQQIASYLELHQSQISYDLKEIIQRWRDSSVSAINERLVVEIERINHLERTYWEAWERSLQPKQQRRKQAKRLAAGKETLSELRSEQRDGNPSYLAGVQWCIEQRLRILGPYKAAEGQEQAASDKRLPFGLMPPKLREDVLRWWRSREIVVLPAPEQQ